MRSSPEEVPERDDPFLPSLNQVPSVGPTDIQLSSTDVTTRLRFDLWGDGSTDSVRRKDLTTPYPL